MRSAIVFKTDKSNHYLYSINKKQLLLIHEILFWIIKGYLKGNNLDKLKFNSIRKGNKHFYKNNEHDVQYYYKKFIFLKDQGYFNKSNYIKEDFKYSSDDIKFQLANSKTIIFEVTDACNLNCRYCIYGELYEHYDTRKSKNLSLKTAKNLLDYISNFWYSRLNISKEKQVNIGFYGGEPLLNFALISEIVNYAKARFSKDFELSFTMTTNCVKLHYYMDYLVKCNFHLLLSIDGNRFNNSYRIFQNSKNSFDKVFNNIIKLKKTYPKYFESNVNFNVVLHNRNSIGEIYNFFNKEFDKIPQISELSFDNVNPEFVEQANSIYRNKQESLEELSNYEAIENEFFLKAPRPYRMFTFIHSLSGFVFKRYDELLYQQERYRIIPTGTCMPFSRRIFLTVNGKILPCEKISQNSPFGEVDYNNVKIDFEEVANIYNKLFNKLKNQCTSCYFSFLCTLCIFRVQNFIDKEKLICPRFTSLKEFESFLKKQISYLEKNPTLYAKILSEVNVDY